mgnify:CR=1 FL=1
MKEFIIPFVGLKEGKHHFEFNITKAFFDFFKYDEFNDVQITTSLLLNKTSTMMELEFVSQGTINVNCDLTNEPFDQDVYSDLKLIVRFGEEFNDENEEILILPHGEYEVDIKQYIYEMIVLAVPNKRVHPKVLDGTMESEALNKLKELTIKEEKTVVNTDPRWDKLKNLITEKKT